MTDLSVFLSLSFFSILYCFGVLWLPIWRIKLYIYQFKRIPLKKISIYSAPDSGRSIVTTVSVCLSVCPPAYLQNYKCNLHPIFVHVCGSALLWRRCDMLCTSGFMDAVIFAHIGQD